MKCPYFSQEIKDGAQKCRFCGEWIKDASKSNKESVHKVVGGGLKKVGVYFLCFIIFGVTAKSFGYLLTFISFLIVNYGLGLSGPRVAGDIEALGTIVGFFLSTIVVTRIYRWFYPKTLPIT